MFNLNNNKGKYALKEQVYYLILFLFLPNLPLYILQLLNYSERPLFNIDHIIISLLFLFLPCKKTVIVTAFLILISLCLDVYFYVINIYHFNIDAALNILSDETFVSISNLLQLIKGFLSLGDVLLISSLSFMFFALYIISLKSFTKNINGVSLRFLLLLIFLLYLSNSFIKFKSENEFRQPFERGAIIHSPAKELVTHLLHKDSQKPANFLETKNHALNDFLHKAKNGQILEEKIIFIMMESLGVFKNDKLQKEFLNNAFKQFDYKRFDLQVETLRSAKYTVQGEVRELCGMLIDKVYPTGREEEFEGCIPNILKERGYKTVAIHNSKIKTFNRHNWYEPLGFEDMYFLEHFKADFDEPQMCREYIRGICDGFISNSFLPKLLQNEDKKFIYWLTLDGHMPLSYYEPTKKEGKTCQAIGLEGELCLYLTVNVSTISGIISMLNGLNDLKNTAIYIVGDHPPPYVKHQYKSEFLKNQVPFIKIKSKLN